MDFHQIFRICLPHEDLELISFFRQISDNNCFHRNTFFPTALKGCRVIVVICGVRMGGRSGGWVVKSLFGLYLGKRKVQEVRTW